MSDYPTPDDLIDAHQRGGMELVQQLQEESAPVVPLRVAVRAQTRDAIAAGLRDSSGDPRWIFPDLHQMVGPLSPGDLWIVGALTGNGKSALLLSQMVSLAASALPVLYFPLEQSPIAMRRRWAAWTLKLDQGQVLRNEWHLLPEGAREWVELALTDQRKYPIFFPEHRQATVAEVGAMIGRGVAEAGVKLVVIDHFHRLDFGGATSNYRVAVALGAKKLKDLAVQFGVSMLCTAQLNGDPDPLDRYVPPQLRRLRESAGIADEADVTLMLSRTLRAPIPGEDMMAIRHGFKNIRDFAAPNVMQVTCRKHRNDDRANDCHVRLAVENGRVANLARSWQVEHGGVE